MPNGAARATVDPLWRYFMRWTALSVLTFVGLAGCPKGGLPVNLDAYRPRLQFERVRVDNIDFNHAETQFVFKLQNPNPVQLRVASW